ncbi:NAD(P)-dependent oxidoreductase [Amylibacter sp.]|nr:NAD(P)-dependent oxidoreductase [Amylibacter sp.]
MRIIVTGASGFVGNRVVKELFRRGIDVCAVSRHPLEFINSKVVDKYVNTPGGDILIHLADNANRTQVNKKGISYVHETRELSKGLISNRYQRIIFASSVAVYGDKLKKFHKPNDNVAPNDIYSQSKLECEEIFENNNGVIARLSNLYGSGMSSNNVFSTITKQLTNSGEIKVWNDQPIRDFLWVHDAVDALVEMALGQSKGIYNVASGKAVSIRELIQIIIMTSPIYKEFKVTVTKPSDEYSSIMLDITETFNSFGWMPKMTLENGIKKLLSKNNQMRIK